MPLSGLGLPSEVLIWHAALLAVISFLVGILGGFVGLALGTMRLPAMLLLGMPAPAAGGTNILVSSLASLAGTIRHLRAGRVNLRIVLTMGVPAFIGAFIGGWFSDVTPEHLLIALAGALVFWQGVEFLIIARDRIRSGQSSGALFGQGLEGSPGLFTPGRMAAEGGIGFAMGMLGGAVGLILGSIRLPALVRILRVDPRIAAGTNLFYWVCDGRSRLGGARNPRSGGLGDPGADGADGDDRQLSWGQPDGQGQPEPADPGHGADAAGGGRPAGLAGHCRAALSTRPRGDVDHLTRRAGRPEE